MICAIFLFQILDQLIFSDLCVYSRQGLMLGASTALFIYYYYYYIIFIQQQTSSIDTLQDGNKGGRGKCDTYNRNVQLTGVMTG